MKYEAKTRTTRSFHLNAHSECLLLLTDSDPLRLQILNFPVHIPSQQSSACDKASAERSTGCPDDDPSGYKAGKNPTHRFSKSSLTGQVNLRLIDRRISLASQESYGSCTRSTDVW